jgi:hypothetical protein
MNDFVVKFGAPTNTYKNGPLAFFFGAVFSADSTLRFFFESILRVENLPDPELKNETKPKRT